MAHIVANIEINYSRTKILFYKLNNRAVETLAIIGLMRINLFWKCAYKMFLQGPKITIRIFANVTEVFILNEDN